ASAWSVSCVSESWKRRSWSCSRSATAVPRHSKASALTMVTCCTTNMGCLAIVDTSATLRFFFEEDDAELYAHAISAGGSSRESAPTLVAAGASASMRKRRTGEAGSLDAFIRRAGITMEPVREEQATSPDRHIQILEKAYIRRDQISATAPTTRSRR